MAVYIGIAGLAIAVAVAIYLLSRRAASDITGPVEEDSRGGDLPTAIAEHISAAYSRSDAAPDSGHLDAIQSQSAQLAEEIARIYETAGATNYDLRWALVNLAADSHPTRSVEFLHRVAAADIPNEATTDTHRFPRTTNELVIRIRAIEGLRKHALRGHEAGVDALFQLVNASHFSVRKAAALGLIGLGDGTTNRDRLLELLPANEHFVLDIPEAEVEVAGVLGTLEAGLRTDAGPQLSTAPDIEPTDIKQETQSRLHGKKGPPEVSSGSIP